MSMCSMFCEGIFEKGKLKRALPKQSVILSEKNQLNGSAQDHFEMYKGEIQG